MPLKKLKYKINTLHCHFGQAGIIGSFLKKNGLCKNLIVSFYGGDLTQYVNSYGKKVYNELFKCADVLIPHSKFLENILIDLGGKSEKIKFMYLHQETL